MKLKAKSTITPQKPSANNLNCFSIIYRNFLQIAFSITGISGLPRFREFPWWNCQFGIVCVYTLLLVSFKSFELFFSLLLVDSCPWTLDVLKIFKGQLSER